MEGTILFADDDIYSETTFEKGLYQSLCEKGQYPIIGVADLNLAINAIKSVSSLKAFIVDYRFNEKSELEEIQGRIRLASEILDNPDLSIFSLIYIYSRDNIENTPDGERFKAKFKERIRFKIKSSNTDKIPQESSEILQEIDQWEKDHQYYQVPFRWNQSINQSVQKIFISLEDADPNWISELYKTSVKDGVEPSVEVINLFQNILSENIIQDDELRRIIKIYAEKGDPLSKPDDYAKLIRILYYGSLNETDPIMTGDIFTLSTDQYGIVISPECDIRHILNEPDKRFFELLKFSKGDFRKSKLEPKFDLKAKPLFEKAKELGITIHKKQCPKLSETFNEQIKNEKKEGLIEAFTHTYPRYHILPCFEFVKDNYSGIALIDFRFGLDLILANDLLAKTRIIKLNSPYIQELRQRYLSYKGRVGVPAFSDELRKWLLKD